MDGAVSSFDQFRLPDMVWERMQTILPKYRKSRKGGRPRDGIPIGLAVDGANVHDIKLLQHTIEDCFPPRLPERQFSGTSPICHPSIVDKPQAFKQITSRIQEFGDGPVKDTN